MKRTFTAIVFLLAMLSWGLKPLYGQPGGTVSLDAAIHNAALEVQERLQERLPQGSRIVVYQFQSPNPRISDYVLKELSDKLINSGSFEVLTRDSEELKAIEAEIEFQFVRSAGMISDDSLASLTERLGAKAIFTGELGDAGSEYRFRIRVIGTETTVALASYSISVNKKDRRIKALSKREPNTGEKIGTGALNILFGLGSYIEGDIAGGLTLTAGDTVAAGLFVVEALALDWDSPAVGVPATIGLTAAILTTVYGFARPFIYHYSPRAVSVMDNTRPRIIFTSDIYGNRNFGLQIAYTVKF